MIEVIFAVCSWENIQTHSLENCNNQCKLVSDKWHSSKLYFSTKKPKHYIVPLIEYEKSMYYTVHTPYSPQRISNKQNTLTLTLHWLAGYLVCTRLFARAGVFVLLCNSLFKEFFVKLIGGGQRGIWHFFLSFFFLQISSSILLRSFLCITWPHLSKQMI